MFDETAARNEFRVKPKQLRGKAFFEAFAFQLNQPADCEDLSAQPCCVFLFLYFFQVYFPPY